MIYFMRFISLAYFISLLHFYFSSLVHIFEVLLSFMFSLTFHFESCYNVELVILCLTCSVQFVIHFYFKRFRSHSLSHMFISSFLSQMFDHKFQVTSFVSHVSFSFACWLVMCARVEPISVSTQLNVARFPPQVAMGWTKARAMPSGEELEKLSWWDVIACPQLIFFFMRITSSASSSSSSSAV